MKFKEYTQDLDWNNTALIGTFKRGLKLEVHQELLKAKINPETKNWALEQWIKLAIKTDNIMYMGRTLSREWEKKAIPGWATSTGGGPSTPCVPEEEVSRRKRENLCIKCRKLGHRIVNAEACDGSYPGL